MALSILIAADFCPKDRVAKLIDVGNFDSVFGEVKQIVVSCDYSIVNLECPVRTSIGNEIKKTGPALKCSTKSVEALKYAGFKCVTLANNHFYDQGESGVKETIESLEDFGIDYVGGGYSIRDASTVLYKKVNDKKLAIINCCEHEWSIASDTTGGSNPLNPIQQYYDIVEAKKKADYVIVIVHGGIEGFQYPSQRMVETYRFFVDAGADAVVNHHQHCYSGGETYKGKPIFYGLGNFCFDWQERRNGSSLWDEGYMVELNFDNGRIISKIIPYLQNTTIPGVHVMNEDAYNNWIKTYDLISTIIQSKDKLNNKYNELLKKTERKYSIYLTPYTNRVFLALYMRKLLPMLLPLKRRRELLNMIMCESHCDRILNMLKNNI